MDRFLNKRPRDSLDSPTTSSPENSSSTFEFNPVDIESDPGLRKQIDEFHINLRDRIRREYCSRQPYQPFGHNFPKTKYGPLMRSFREEWFKMFDWLEYSTTKDVAYCSRQIVINHHHYRVEVFCEVVDLVAQEIDNRFSEASTDLLLSVTCLDPRYSYSNFNVDKLVHLAELYPEDFSWTERLMIQNQLEMYIYDVKKDKEFSLVEDLESLAKKMIAIRKSQTFPLVYRLIELALLLSVATASVERVFSSMNIVKTDLQNRMGDEWMNDCLVVYIEKEVFARIDKEVILQRFQKISSRRIQLPSTKY